MSSRSPSAIAGVVRLSGDMHGQAEMHETHRGHAQCQAGTTRAEHEHAVRVLHGGDDLVVVRLCGDATDERA